MIIATVNRKRSIERSRAAARRALSAFGISFVVVGQCLAQNYPSKPIRFVLPLASGSPIDAIARLMAPTLSSRLGQSIVAENRAGGGGTIATKAVAAASSDGYTLLFTGLNLVIAPSLLKSADYDPVKDFAPAATMGTGSWTLVVTPSLRATSVKELVSYAKANPGRLNWGYGLATAPHLYGEMFLTATGIDVARVPYKSGPQSLPDILGGRIHMNFGVTANFFPLIQDGKLRALAVTSESRDRNLPEIPTMIESGLPRLTRGFWAGLLTPKATPSSIVNRLNAEINLSLETVEIKASLARLGFQPKITSPKEFAAFITEESGAWTAAAKAGGIIPE